MERMASEPGERGTGMGSGGEAGTSGASGGNGCRGGGGAAYTRCRFAGGAGGELRCSVHVRVVGGESDGRGLVPEGRWNIIVR